MTLPEPPIGVVIVSINTRELLRGCLESLKDCRLPLRIAVIDNGSTDGSQRLVADEFPEVLLVEPGCNLGFGAGNNLGIDLLVGAHSQGTHHSTFCTLQPPSPDYMLLLNPDTVVQPGAIEALVAFLDDHPRVGMVGARLLNSDGTVQHSAFRFPTLGMALLDLFPPGEALPGRLYNSWWHGRYPQEQQADPAAFPIDHPLGACMLVRRSTLLEVGGFDERYFMYSEEIDLCWRIRAAGWAIWQVPQARVTHYGGAATGQFRQRLFIELYRSRLQFAAQHRGLAFQRAQRLIVRAGLLRGILRAWNDYRAARISREELRARLWAFGQALGLLRRAVTIDE